MSYNGIAWHRLGAGHYTSKDGEWSVRSWRRNEWWVFRDGELWGRWKPEREWLRYIPFRAKWEAMLAIEKGYTSCSSLRGCTQWHAPASTWDLARA